MALFTGPAARKYWRNAGSFTSGKGVALRAVQDFLAENEGLEEVRFVCFDTENYLLYRGMLSPS